MSKRRFEMFHYRQVLARMRQGDSDRDIARSKVMGRRKAAQIRAVAEARGWLGPEVPLPDDATLAAAFARKEGLPASCVSSLEPWREQITAWHNAGIQGTTIHAALVRNHGYTGSYSSVNRFVGQLIRAIEPEVPLRLEFRPGEAAQVDFGAGPVLVDALSGVTFKTWFFVMTLCWSRHQYVELVQDQSTATWLGRPCVVNVDNASWHTSRAFLDRMGAWANCGVVVHYLPPYSPELNAIETLWRKIKYEWLPLDCYASYQMMKSAVLGILDGVGSKYQICFV